MGLWQILAMLRRWAAKSARFFFDVLAMFPSFYFFSSNSVFGFFSVFVFREPYSFGFVGV